MFYRVSFVYVLLKKLKHIVSIHHFNIDYVILLFSKRCSHQIVKSAKTVQTVQSVKSANKVATIPMRYGTNTTHINTFNGLCGFNTFDTFNGLDGFNYLQPYINTDSPIFIYFEFVLF